MARWVLPWCLWPWAPCRASSRCWDGDFRPETCCGEAPLRHDCWVPQFGLTPEACCGSSPESGASNFGKSLHVHRANALVFTIQMAVDLLSRPGNCSRVLNPIFKYLRRFYRSSLAVFRKWWFFQDPRDRLEFQAACFGPSSTATQTQLILLELMLAFLGMRMGSSQPSVAMFQKLASSTWAAIYRKSRSTWASAARSAEASSLRASPAKGAACCMHIAMVASVGSPVFGRKAMAGVRSALFFARQRALAFHLLVDREGEADVRSSLGALEGWLRARGRFEFHRVDRLPRASRLLRALVPADCLNFGAHYGSAGWLRLLAHEIIEDRGVEAVLWVDAGDYVFLHDPADLLLYHSQSSAEQVVGAPEAHPLPFQLYDLPKMRRVNWTDRVAEVVREGYAEMGAEFCTLGEGWAMNRLAQGANAHYWYWLPSSWAYEPWTDWMPGHGVVDLWSPRAAGLRAVWRERVLPGLGSFQALRVHCPSALESLANGALRELLSGAPMEVAVAHAGHHQALRARNASILDPSGQALRCNAPALGVHLVMPFHFLPWAHRFLDFWAGARVWDPHWDRGRDLRSPGPGGPWPIR